MGIGNRSIGERQVQSLETAVQTAATHAVNKESRSNGRKYVYYNSGSGEFQALTKSEAATARKTNKALLERKSFSSLAREYQKIGQQRTSDEKKKFFTNLHTLQQSAPTFTLVSDMKKVGKKIFEGSAPRSEKLASVAKEIKKPIGKTDTKEKLLSIIDKQISADESKIQGLTAKMKDLTDPQGQADDAKRDIMTLSSGIEKLRAFKVSVTSFKKDIMDIQNDDQMKSADGVIEPSLVSASTQATDFKQLGQQLIDRFVKDGAMKKGMHERLNNAFSSCQQNIQESESRKEDKVLWGLSAKMDLNSQLDAVNMVNKVMLPVRANTGEIMPSFGENFHKQVILGEVLKEAIAKGLEKPTPPADEMTPAQEKQNLNYFSSINPKEADALNKAYTNLWAAYKGRGADPMKYLKEAMNFLTLYEHSQPEPQPMNE